MPNTLAFCALLQVMLSERNLVEFWRGHTRVHTVVTLHLEPTAHSGARQTSSSTSVRLIGLTGVPDVSLREALQLSHSEQGKNASLQLYAVVAYSVASSAPLALQPQYPCNA